MRKWSSLLLPFLCLSLTGDINKRDGFTIAGGSSAALPTTNLLSYYESDAGVYSDAGTTLLNAIGDDETAVQQWNDQQGSSNIVQTTAGNKPIFDWNQHNSLPGVRFDGTDDFLELNSALLSTEPFTVYIVFESDDATVDQVIASFDRTTASDGWIFSAKGGTAGDPVGYDVYNGTDNNLEVGAYSANVVHLYKAESASDSAHAVALDGGTESTGSTATTVSGVNEFYVGKRHSGTPFSGWIYGIYVYSVALDASAEADFEAYVDGKFAIAGL